MEIQACEDAGIPKHPLCNMVGCFIEPSAFFPLSVSSEFRGNSNQEGSGLTSKIEVEMPTPTLSFVWICFLTRS